MKYRIYIISIVMTMVSVLYWLQSCDSTSFTNGHTAALIGDQESAEQVVQEVQPSEPDPVDSKEDVVPIAKNLDTQFLTPEQKEKEFKILKEDPTSQNGKKVKICIAYTGTYLSPTTTSNGHSGCNKARFNVYFNDSEKPDPKELNLNNGSAVEGDVGNGRVMNLITGGKITIDSKTKTDRNALDSSFSEAKKDKIIEHRRQNHIPGTEYQAVWKDGAVQIKTVCALENNSCSHNGAIVAISMVGEVTISDGSKKYLYAERVVLPTVDKVSTQTYDFSSFELVDEEYQFDDFCGVELKTE